MALHLDVVRDLRRSKTSAGSAARRLGRSAPASRSTRSETFRVSCARRHVTQVPRMRRHSPKANLLVQSPQLLPQSLGERGEKVVQGLSHDETHVVTVALGLHLRWVLHSALREIGAPCDSQDGESMGTECPAPHLSASRSSSCAKDWLLRDPTTPIDTANRSTARGFDEFPTGALPAAVGHGRAPQDRTPEHLTLAPDFSQAFHWRHL